MFKKIALNIFLTIGIVVLILGTSWSFKHDYYGYTTGGLLAITVFVYLKVQLIKSVRNLTKKPQ